MKSSKHLTMLLMLLITAALFMSGCSKKDEEPLFASVLPGINPAFDQIIEVASSGAAKGPYSVMSTADYSYDKGTELINFNDTFATDGGKFVRIEGKATIDGAQDTYIVYTYVVDSTTNIAANELTTIAVARMASAATPLSFADAIEEVANDMGIPEGAHHMVTHAMKALDRATVAGDSLLLHKAMRMLAPNFTKDVLGSDNALGKAGEVELVNLDEFDHVEQGALFYDNWMAAMEVSQHQEEGMNHDMHMSVSARADMGAMAGMEGHMHSSVGVQATELLIKGAEGEEDHVLDSFARCSSCHGYDRMGKTGGMAFFEAEKHDGLFWESPAPTSNMLAIAENADEADVMAMILGGDTGNRYGNHASAPVGGWTENDATTWNTEVEALDGANNIKSAMHPDFTRNQVTGTDGMPMDDVKEDGSVVGKHNSFVPSEHQIDALTMFLKAPEAQTDKVFDAITVDAGTVNYVVVASADASRGEKYYANYCFRCHGAPNNANAMNPLKVAGGFMTYLDTAGNYSKLMHVAHWGKAGTVMTRDRIGYPSAANVADVIKYLQSVKSGDYDANKEGLGFTGVGDKHKGMALYDTVCGQCHSLGEYDKTAREFDHAGEMHKAPDLAMGYRRMKSDLNFISANMADKKISQQEINDLSAFISNNAMPMGSMSGM